MEAYELLQTATEQFKPPERIAVSEWAQQYYELPETSAEPGKWLPSRAPYQQGIMDAINEQGVNRVTLMCAAQVGKTIILLAIICYFIDLDPCSMLMTQPTTEMAETFSKEKLASAINNVKPVSKKIVQKSRNASSTILMKMFAGGFLRLSGANSPSSLASMSIRLYLGDEIDKYPPSAGKEGDPVQLAIERTSTFWNSLVMLVSTPSIKGSSRIESEYEQSDKRLPFVPCPHCNHFHVLDFANLEYLGKGTDSADPVASGVFFVCPSCGNLIAEKHKAEMIRHLEWRATAKPKNPGHVGFQLSRFYSPWVRWLDIAQNYESARHDPQQLQVFWNATLGLPYEKVAGEKLEWEKLRDRARQSNYSQGTVPNSALILTAGVDVQADRLEAAILGWGRGERLFVVRYEKILGDPLGNEVWEQLLHLTSQEYKRIDGATLRVRATCVDSGYLTQEVYTRIKKHRHLHWFAIKGQSGDRPLVSRPSVQEINYKGKKARQGIELYKVGVDLAKETLYARSQIETPGAKYLSFAKDLPDDWFEGFCSEVQVVKQVAGRPVVYWEKLPGVRNEPLDTAGYALAAAHLVGLTRMNWSKLEKDLSEQLTEPPSIPTKSGEEDVKKTLPRQERGRGKARVKRRRKTSY